MRELLLYTTVGCHLCEQAEELLAPVLRYIGSETDEGESRHIVLRKVEIADDAELVADYGMRIPVIRMDGSDQELGWPFDQARAFEFLNGQLAVIRE